MITMGPKIGALLFASVSAGASGQPIIVQVSPDRHQTIVLMAQTAVLLAQTVLLSMIAVWTFRSGSRQRMRERRAGWYQKVVVDHVLPVLEHFFRSQSESLTRAASRCTQLRAVSDDRALEMLVKEAIASFKNELYPMQALISDRTAVFDPQLGTSVRESLDGLEERLTEWFDVHAYSHSRQNQKTLRDLLSESETEVVKMLYDFEFAQFG